ncbi:MAG: hypothetical protein AB9891_11570 [Anaerolineaceae bacterium]
MNGIGHLPAILEKLQGAGFKPGQVNIRQNTLEDVFHPVDRPEAEGMKLSRSIARILAVTRKTLLETLRDPVLLVLLLGLPVFFMLITYVGYGHTPRTATYKVMVLSNTSQADELLEKIRTSSYSDGRPCFALLQVKNRSEAEPSLESKKGSRADNPAGRG